MLFAFGIANGNLSYMENILSTFFEDLQIGVKYIRNENYESFVYVKISDDLWSLLKVPSTQFEMFIRKAYYSNNRSAPSKQQIAEIMENVRSKCLFDGKKQKIFLRIAPLFDGGIEVDLGYENNACVKITSQGWFVHTTPENLFFRPDSQQPLPFPETGGSIDALKNFLNYESEEDFGLMLGFILGAFRPNSTYAHLVLQGEQGCGKTTVTKVIKALVDNTNGGLRGLPRDEQTLFISTQNAHLLSFDNLSGMNVAQSDNFCRLATGGAFSTRALYSNGEEFTIEARKPVIVNGIDNIATRPDLADRSIILTLPRMRTTVTGEAEFWDSFERQAPAIMGALMDGLAYALKNQAVITVPDTITPRTRDFARWAEAGCRGMGLPENGFLDAYVNNRNSAKVDTAFMDPVVMTLHKFMGENAGNSWEGTISELLENLTVYIPINRPRSWPTSAIAFTNHLNRVAPVLNSVGIEYERIRTASRRTIIVTKSAAFSPIHSDNNDAHDECEVEDTIPEFNNQTLAAYNLRAHDGELPF